MNSKFNFEQLTDHVLYHVGNGKGALIVAVQRKDLMTGRGNRENYQEDSKTEAFRAQKLSRSEAHSRLEKITSINESNGLLKISLENCDRSVRGRVHQLRTGIHDLKNVRASEGRLTRVVPIEDVTLEIIGSQFF